VNNVESGKKVSCQQERAREGSLCENLELEPTCKRGGSLFYFNSKLDLGRRRTAGAFRGLEGHWQAKEGKVDGRGTQPKREILEKRGGGKNEI